MDKKANLKETIIAKNLELDYLVKQYFLNNYGFSWGVREIAELRKKSNLGTKARAILDYLMSLEDFPFELRTIEGEEILVVCRYQFL